MRAGQPGARLLDAGEAEAIALAVELKADLLLRSGYGDLARDVLTGGGYGTGKVL